jgi:hypothetical protein
MLLLKCYCCLRSSFQIYYIYVCFVSTRIYLCILLIGRTPLVFAVLNEENVCSCQGKKKRKMLLLSSIFLIVVLIQTKLMIMLYILLLE